MRLLLLCKRRYTNRDLINDKFGRLYHFPRCWVDAGHEVAIHAIDYRSLKGEIRDLDGIEAHSHPLQTLPLLDRIVARLLKQRGQRPDVVMASGDSHLGYLGLRLARRLGVPFVFDVYDHYPDFAGNRLPGMGWMFREAVKHADLLSCASRPLAERLQSIGDTPHAIAPNGVDPHLFQPMDRHACRAQLGLDASTRYLCYTGSLGQHLDLRSVTDAARQLRAGYPGLKVLFAGTNPDHEALDPDLFIDYGLLPQERIPLLINAADVALLPYLDTPQVRLSNPCKLSEYIACGVPLVTADVSDIGSYLSVRENSLYPVGDVDAMAQAIQAQLSTPVSQPIENATTWKDSAMRFMDEIKMYVAEQRSPIA